MNFFVEAWIPKIIKMNRWMKPVKSQMAHPFYCQLFAASLKTMNHLWRCINQAS